MPLFKHLLEPMLHQRGQQQIRRPASAHGEPDPVGQCLLPEPRAPGSSPVEPENGLAAGPHGSGRVPAQEGGDRLIRSGAELQLFSVNNITSGTDAQGEVTVRLAKGGRIVNGQGADTDIVVASAKAYINALNKLLVKREKREPEALTVAR